MSHRGHSTSICRHSADWVAHPFGVAGRQLLVIFHLCTEKKNCAKEENERRGQAWRSGEVFPTCAKRSWVRTSLYALHFAGLRLSSYNPFPFPDLTLYGSFFALGLSFVHFTYTIFGSFIQRFKCPFKKSNCGLNLDIQHRHERKTRQTWFAPVFI